MIFSNRHRYTKVETSDDEQRDRQRRRGLSRPGVRGIIIVTYAVLILSNLFTLTMWLQVSTYPSYRDAVSTTTDDTSCVRPQLTFSSAKENNAIQYTRQRLFRSIDESNPFTGPPSETQDRAWSHLLEPITTLITPEEYSSADLGASTLMMADKSGYVAEITAYHELHCIKQLRRWIHREHYYPNMTHAEYEFQSIHIDHCLEYWREAAMCRGDSSLATFFWRDGVPTSRAWSDHECVDWRLFDGWARQRMADMSDLEALNQEGRWDYIRRKDGYTVLRADESVIVHP